MKTLGAISLWLYGVACLLAIYALPVNWYEWMLDEPGAKAEGLTLCDLPLDDGIDGRIATIVMLLPLMMLAGALSVNRRKIHFSVWLVLALLLIWGWRFFIHYPLCPGHENF